MTVHLYRPGDLVINHINTTVTLAKYQMQITAERVLIPQMSPFIFQFNICLFPPHLSPCIYYKSAISSPPPIYPPTFSLPLCSSSLCCLFSHRHNSVWDVASCTCGEAGGRGSGGGTEGANAIRGEAPASAGKQRGASPL